MTMMKKTTSPSRAGLWRALLDGFRAGPRHWRLIVLAWLAGVLPAALAMLPVFSMFNRALGEHPDAATLVRGGDIAPLADAVMTLPDGGLSAALEQLGDGLTAAVFLTLLLAPWLAGMLVASLREGRALRFGELWAGGWREYGRQFRLLLVSLIPWMGVAMLAGAAGYWARQGEETRILQSVGEQRQQIAMWVMLAAGFLAWTSIEAARAAFAADAGLRSAFHAWLRGLRLMLRRPIGVLLVMLLTAGLGLVMAMMLQRPGIDPQASTALVLVLAQLAVVALWWTRMARLTALAAISPSHAPPAIPVAAGADATDIDTPSRATTLAEAFPAPSSPSPSV